jgi:hypothetical protein
VDLDMVPGYRWWLVLVATAVLVVACSSSGDSATSWNDTRVKQGFDPKGNREALAVLDRIERAGLPCTDKQTQEFQLLVKNYTAQKIPFPLGAASCTGPGGENLLVELYRADGYPTAADFMARKRELICQKALDLGKDPKGGPNNFDGIPYVLAKDGSWVIEPDSFAVNRQLARALGLPSRNACQGMTAKK